MRATRLSRAVAMLALGAVLAPGVVRADPKANTSAYFRSVGGGFTTNNKSGSVALNLTLEPLKTLPPDAELVVTFENPANPSSPLVVETTVQAAQTKKGNWIDVASPPVTGMRDKSTYLITARLYADKSKKVLLGTHEQRVACHQDMLDFAAGLKPSPKH